MTTATVILIVITLTLGVVTTLLLSFVFYLKMLHKKEVILLQNSFKTSPEFNELVAQAEEAKTLKDKQQIYQTQLMMAQQQISHKALEAVIAFKTSQEFQEIISQAQKQAVLSYKTTSEFLELLNGKVELKYCEEKMKKRLLEENNNFQKILQEKEREFAELQKQFDFEKRYKNVSIIGSQLKDSIVNRLIESFSMSGLVNIDENPEMKRMPTKKHKSIKTDILVDFYSPISPNHKLLRIVIEAKNCKPDTVEQQKNRRHFEQVIEQLEAYEADYALLVSELEPDNHALTISPIENRDNAFVLRFSYLIGFMQVLIRFALSQQLFNQNTRELKNKEALMKLIDAGIQEMEEKQFRFLSERNKQIREKCDSIKSLLDDIDELTQKNDRRLRISSNKLLSFYKNVRKNTEQLLLPSNPTNSDPQSDLKKIET